MRPTRRAYVVLAVVAAGIVSGSLFGARSLNAVVVPALVALVGAVVQMWRAPTPTIDRTLPAARPAGTRGTVDLRLDAPRPYPATVSDRLPPGIDSGDADVDNGNSGAADTTATAAVDATLGGDDVSYEITPRRRGEHEIGPATVVVTDVLGLVARTTEVDSRGTLLVFPSVRRLQPGARTELLAASGAVDPRPNGRDTFESLREYVPGDPLRDVHWKSSAKRGDLVVQEFTGEPDRDRVVVVAGLAMPPGDGQRVDPDEDGATAAGADSDGSTAAGADSNGNTAAGPDSGGSTAADPDSGRIAATEADPGSDGTGRDADALDVAERDSETVDAMAEAAATVCLSALDDGVPISLATPSGTVTAAPGTERPVLEHLATVEGGPVPTVDADLVVTASDGAASIRAGGITRRFADLVAGGDGSAWSDSHETGASQRDGTGNEPARRSDVPPTQAGDADD